MDLLLAKKLMSEIPEMKEFVAFLSEEARKLNVLEDIELNDINEIALEVKARRLAFKKIVDILEPLISVDNRKPVDTSKDYVC